MNRRRFRWFSRWASGRWAGCHVLGSTAPNTRYRSVRQLGPRARKYIHAEIHINTKDHSDGILLLIKNISISIAIFF